LAPKVMANMPSAMRSHGATLTVRGRELGAGMLMLTM
jgi:hypothetical protein